MQVRLHIYYVTLNGLKVEVQIAQQWFSLKRRFKNPVVDQSMRLDISVSLQYTPES